MTIISSDHWKNTIYGRLHMKSPIYVEEFSHKKVVWICSCGNESKIGVYSVTTGNTKTCGKCDVLSADELRKIKYGKLSIEFPLDTQRGSGSKVSWICDCGKKKFIKFYDVIRGHVKTCGSCNKLTNKDFEGIKYGKLIMIKPGDFHPGSNKIVEWACDCGKVALKSVKTVTSGNTKSCGSCSVLFSNYWEKAEFGYLRMKTPINISPGSNKKVEWACKCGGVTTSDVYSVTNGKIVRCNFCRSRATDWYEENKENLRSLKTPIQIYTVPLGWVIPLELIYGYDKPFQALCGACNSVYFPIWGNIVKGSSLTCGCVSNHISSAQRNIAKFLESLNLCVSLEFKISALKYDIFVPSKNFLIEYNGLKWHSNPESKRRDLEKYELAISKRYEFVSIFEDEWLLNKSKVENLLKNKLIKTNSKKLRPSQCEIRKIGSEVNGFYEKYHYIGKCKAKIHYGVYFENELVSAISFGIPTRQTSKYPWELIRMASNPEYRIHGIWSKLLKQFISEYSPKSIVSFSDNRLFSGKVYEKIGFKYDGNLSQDYYWVKNGKRFHKSGLRKKGKEKISGFTEYQLREAQGYSRIWDLGKKRWVLDLVV